jgi:hypothetical protein
MVEGKDLMPFKAYKYLANILMKSSDPEHIALNLFLLLDWNLISRANHAVNVNLELIGMFENCIALQIGKTKGNQEGTKHLDHPWHIYSVPSNPAICPVLAFSRHLICNPLLFSGGCKLFEGSNQYERFSNMLRDIINSPEHIQKFASLGMPARHFGTHSLRKGTISLVACGVTSCPPIASICLRANWKMPGIMNHFIRFEKAGDFYVISRSVSRRERHEHAFVESIPSFDFSSDPNTNTNTTVLDNWIRSRMPEEGRYSDNILTFLASLAFHSQYLEKTVHQRSPPYGPQCFGLRESYLHITQ